MGGLADLRVLVAEDNDMNWMVMDGTLRRWGVQGDRAENGQVALDAAKETPYDVILMDIDMPVMDGMEATRRIKAELGDDRPRIFAVTANMMAGEESAREDLFDAVMYKPIEPERLHGWLEGVPRRNRDGGSTDSVAPSRPSTNGAVKQFAPQMLDMSALEGMLSQVGEEVVESIMQEFTGSAPAICTTLAAALRDGDVDVARKDAHKLKSMAGYVGAKELQQLCLEIDTPDYGGMDDTTATRLEGLVDGAVQDVLGAIDAGWAAKHAK